MNQITISENLLPRLEKEYQCIVEITGKVCDFCNQRLDKSFTSQKCVLCDTLFDECEKCKLWPRLNSFICHKKHAPNNKNDDFSIKELDSIEKAEETVTVYGCSLTDRNNMQSCARRIPSSLFLDDPEFLRLNNCEKAAKFVENGGRLEIREAHHGMLLRVSEKKLKRIK